MTRPIRLFVLACVLSLAAASSAYADAPDPIPSATDGFVTVNGDGSRTLTVWGGTNATTAPGWQWTTHNSDCNTDRSGAGVAMVWNDPTQQGNAVTGAPGTFYVGLTPSGLAGDLRTPQTDNVIHPTPQELPAKPANVDIATPSQWQSWRGGCGLYVNHGPTSLPDGTVKSGNWSQGTWGPFTHTYPASVKGAIAVCPVMYDVHGNSSGSQPAHESDVTAGGSGHDSDNSIEKNGSTPQGNGCFTSTFSAPHLTIVKEVSKDGGATWSKSVTVLAGDSVKYRFVITNDGDTGADLTGVHVNELTTISDCDSSLSATSPAAFAGNLAVGDSATFECDHVMGTADLHNTAKAEGSYTPPHGSAQPVASAVDSADVDVAKHQPQLSTNVASSTVGVGHSVTDTATLTGGYQLQGQTVTFEVFGPNDPACAGPATAIGSGTINATGHATSGSFTPSAAGTYLFVAHYAGNSNNFAADGGCGDANETVDAIGLAVVNVVKDANSATAFDGDKISFTISATNSGADALKNVSLVDAIKGTSHTCESVSGPTGDNGNGQLDVGETWKYVCTITVVHGEENASHEIVNVAHIEGDTVTGGDHVVSNEDDAATRILHPAIAIDKSGPATGQAGDKIGYVLTVTNPGDEAFPEASVKVTDQQCNGPVTLLSKGGDLSGGTLDPGDTWTYSCSVQTAVGDTAVHNIASVDVTDPFDKHATAQASADTILTQPAQIVLPARIVPGTAKLLGPTGCAAKAFNARVNGTKIATVTFVLDGKVVKRFKKPLASGSYALRITPAKLRLGVHRLVANVTFQSGTGTKPKTIRLSFQRCGKKLAAPRFTG